MDFSPNHHYVQSIDELHCRNQKRSPLSTWGNTGNRNIWLMLLYGVEANDGSCQQEHIDCMEDADSVSNVLEDYLKWALVRFNTASSKTRMVDTPIEEGSILQTEPHSRRKQHIKRPCGRIPLNWDGETIDPKWLRLNEGGCDFDSMLDQYKAYIPKLNIKSVTRRQKRSRKQSTIDPQEAIDERELPNRKVLNELELPPALKRLHINQ